jgi:hypothetical protein
MLIGAHSGRIFNAAGGIVGGNVGRCRRLHRRGADAAVSVKTDGASYLAAPCLVKITWRPSTWVALAIGAVA